MEKSFASHRNRQKYYDKFPVFMREKYGTSDLRNFYLCSTCYERDEREIVVDIAFRPSSPPKSAVSPSIDKPFYSDAAIRTCPACGTPKTSLGMMGIAKKISSSSASRQCPVCFSSR